MKMRLSLPAITVAFLLSGFSNANEQGATVSRIKLEGACEQFAQNNVKAPAESLTAAIAATVATAAVKEIFVLGQKWFADFKDSYKGSDTATNVEFFYCKTDAAKPIGIKPYITYERTTNGKTDIKFSSLIKMHQGVGKNPGFFTITPYELAYKNNIAKRGKTKDITIIYSFTFIDNTGKETVVSSTPILIKNATSNTTLTSLDSTYGIKAILPLPYELPVNSTDGDNIVTNYSPVILKAEVIEVSVGKGEELLGNIASNIGASLEKQQDVLVPLLVSKLLGDIKKDEDSSSNGKTPTDQNTPKTP